MSDRAQDRQDGHRQRPPVGRAARQPKAAQGKRNRRHAREHCRRWNSGQL
nr:MAG TPA: hypothetical protein [Caudoviricetes sp.]DAH98883.1 MAG TPA: hypothetical protein [Caudoviricetes sp.]